MYDIVMPFTVHACINIVKVQWCAADGATVFTIIVVGFKIVRAIPPKSNDISVPSMMKFNIKLLTFGKN